MRQHINLSNDTNGITDPHLILKKEVSMFIETHLDVQCTQDTGIKLFSGIYHQSVAPTGASRNCLRQLYFKLKGRGIGYSFQLAITATLYTIIVYCITSAQSWIQWSCLCGMLERKFHRGLGPVLCQKWLFVLFYSTWDSLCKLICTRRRRCLANISFNYYYSSIKKPHLGTNIVKHWLDLLTKNALPGLKVKNTWLSFCWKKKKEKKIMLRWVGDLPLHCLAFKSINKPMALKPRVYVQVSAWFLS